MKEMTENNYSHLESAVHALNRMFEINAIASQAVDIDRKSVV